jgi:hypothetical protein
MSLIVIFPSHGRLGRRSRLQKRAGSGIEEKFYFSAFRVNDDQLVDEGAMLLLEFDIQDALSL